MSYFDLRLWGHNLVPFTRVFHIGGRASRLRNSVTLPKCQYSRLGTLVIPLEGIVIPEPKHIETHCFLTNFLLVRESFSSHLTVVQLVAVVVLLAFRPPPVPHPPQLLPALVAVTPPLPLPLVAGPTPSIVRSCRHWRTHGARLPKHHWLRWHLDTSPGPQDRLDLKLILIKYYEEFMLDIKNIAVPTIDGITQVTLILPQSSGDFLRF